MKNKWEVNGRDVWGKTHWKKVYDIAQSKNISIGHVSAHQKPKNPEAKWNQMADDFARINVVQNSEAEWLGKWLHEWLGHAGSYDFFQQAARKGWPVTKTLAKQIVDSCHFCQTTVQ